MKLVKKGPSCISKEGISPESIRNLSTCHHLQQQKEIIKSKLKRTRLRIFFGCFMQYATKNASNCSLNQERDRMNKSFEALQQRVATQLDEAWPSETACVLSDTGATSQQCCERLRDAHLRDPNVEALSVTCGDRRIVKMLKKHLEFNL